MLRRSLAILLILFSISSGLKAQIFVAPDGDDLNPGTIELPLKTLVKAMTYAGLDSLIYMRGGVYAISSTITTSKSGEIGKYIKVWAYPGESPVLDFSTETYGARGIQISQSYWHFKGLEIKNAGDNGIHISGGHNRVERCVLHNNKDSGLQISNGGNNNIIVNCDSYENYDPNTHGGNADGFSPKLDVGAGNEFHGCRAWNNSDDGWDCYGANYASIIDSCWTFRNGINIWGDPAFVGNGNGFKVGGNYTIALHTVTNCLSFDNVVKGFDQNHNAGGVTLYNCIAWRNGRNYSFPDTLRSGMNVVKNNISFQSISTSVSFNSRFTEQATNSWLGFTVTSSDFLAFDTTLATAPRRADGTLPDNNFLHLAPSSSMVNAGTNVGLPYNGSAPDLGPFETGSVVSYTLTLSHPNGSVTKNPDLSSYPGGSSVQLTALPDGGYHFVNWSGDQGGSQNPVSVTMDGDKNITANFALNEYLLTTTAVNGSIAKDPDQTTYTHGSTVRLTALPDEGYLFEDWSGDILETTNPVDIIIDAGKNIEANFSIMTFVITASAGPNGAIAPADSISVSYGSELSFAFVPDPGYSVDTLLVDGSVVPDSTHGYTFSEIMSDHAIRVTFKTGTAAVIVTEGWNMISLPLDLPDPRSSALFPEASSPAFSYDGGYILRDSLVNGKGYWIKFPLGQEITLTGEPVNSDTVEVTTGWNLIGSISLSVSVAGIEQIPEGIVISPFFGYDGTYGVSDTLQPSRAYWVKASAPGRLVLVP